MADQPRLHEHGSPDADDFDGVTPRQVRHWIYEMIAGSSVLALFLRLWQSDAIAAVAAGVGTFAITHLIGGALRDRRAITARVRKVLNVQYQTDTTRLLAAKSEYEQYEKAVKDRDTIIAEDREWSASPFVHITAEPVNCDVNIGQRTITMRIRLSNGYAKPRQVWVIANVAVYRAGPEGPILFRIPAPAMTALVPAKGHIDAHSPWPVKMSGEQADQMLAAYRMGGIQVSLDHVRLTTLINLTSEPTATTTELPALGNRVVVEQLWE